MAALVEALALGHGGGPRVAVKDVIDIAGYPTRAGSRALGDAPPAARHAVVVQRLLDAGCRIIGKANMHELAFGVTGVNAWTGTPENPRFPDYVPGGSSSGSAAIVAAGGADFALGTDTGGSIRVPAACCGIVGLKPSFGRVSREGVHPVASTLDCVGPIAADVAGVERAMAAIDPSFASRAAPDGVTIGIVAVEADDDVQAVVAAALDAADARRRPVTLKSLCRAYDAGLTVIGAEVWRAFGHLLSTGQVGADVAARINAGARVDGEELAEAEAVRACFASEVDAALEVADVLALPTLPAPPPLVSDRDPLVAVRMTRLVRPFNLSGHPAITLPLAAGGLPAGLQLVGRRGEDALLCAIARGIEAARSSAVIYPVRELSA